MFVNVYVHTSKPTGNICLIGCFSVVRYVCWLEIVELCQKIHLLVNEL